MRAFAPEQSKYIENNNSDCIYDAPKLEKEDEGLPVEALIKELREYIYAVQEKTTLARKYKKNDLVKILEAVAGDMNKVIRYYESGDLSFNNCYEEIVSLYVFIEIYFKFDNNK